MDDKFPFCALCGAQALSIAAKFCSACGGGLPVDELAANEKKANYLQDGYLLKQQYRIYEHLGEGGMGTVYKAQDIKLNRPVAVKEMHLQGVYGRAEIQDAVNGFRQEAQMLASLKHHSIPLIYDYFDELSHWYLVMEFIEGTTLSEYLANTQEGYLSIDKVIEIGIKFCTVLEYLHTYQPHHIIFRDVKPDNIMYTPDRRLCLIDFGIARNFHPTILATGQKADTASLGTWGYAPPEQCGKSARTTPRSDIYALGATLHQLLTGKDPTVKSDFLFDPLELGAQIGAVELEELIMHMVKRAESERPENVVIIKHRLEDIGKLRCSQLLFPPSLPVSEKLRSTVVLPLEKSAANSIILSSLSEQTSRVEISTSEKVLQDFILPKQTQLDVSQPSLTSFISNSTGKFTIELFVAYAHKDERLRSELDAHLSSLKRQGSITHWYDGEIGPGKHWSSEINKHLESAHIILLLISSYFIASDYCYSIEMEKALERHKNKEAHVIPIILREVYWERTPIGQLQALPQGGKAITRWSDRHRAFREIAMKLQKIVDQILAITTEEISSTEG